MKLNIIELYSSYALPIHFIECLNIYYSSNYFVCAQNNKFEKWNYTQEGKVVRSL